MAGHKGVELSGPYEEMETVKAALLRAGERHGLRRGGTQAYFSTLMESGWMAYPMPAIFTGDDLRGFREWLPADGWEGNQHLGGSFYASDIEQYYVTPWDLGYGRFVAFDHDFIGREALEKQSDEHRRTKVTLVWDDEDVMRVLGSQFGDGPRYKIPEFPVSYYGFPHFDEVRGPDDQLAGLSCHCGYSANDRVMLSLAMIDERMAEIGTELVLTWGEPDGGSRKPEVGWHAQVQIRATVAPVPYSQAVRTMKRATIGASTA
jgi:vanillate/3-O-methylgallate O-demethylase